MNMAEEAAIRAHERLKVLRQVRKVASRMDRNPANDPHLWGFGGGRIVAMLSKLVADERDRQGVTAWQKDTEADGNKSCTQLTFDFR